MSKDSTTHPNNELLVAFGLGRLEPDALLAVESHLEQCTRCCDTLLNLKDDTFVGLVRQASEPVAEPVDESLPATNPDQPGDASGGLRAEAPSLAATLVANSAAARDRVVIPPELANHPRYRIIELIGRGGMGDVYKAEHRVMNRIVALKVINQDLVRNRQAVERFRREVQAAARLSHPHIVTSHDAEQVGNLHCLVMEYVGGTNLADVVKREGPLDVPRACDYIRQAAAGLQQAHEQGLVHRDIKPHNLMVTHGGQVKILDFGLATLADVAHEASGGRESPDETPSSRDSEPGHLTAAGTMMGTPDFISPEQAGDAHSVDIRSDLYSLGCTLYFLLTGRPPFDEGSAMDRVKAHADRETTPIDTVRADVPAELAEVLRRMLAKDPADRFQSPSDVADALAPFVDEHRSGPLKTGGATSAEKTPGPVSRLDRFAIGVACLTAACLLLAMSGMQMQGLAVVWFAGTALAALFSWWWGANVPSHGLTRVGLAAGAMSVLAAGVIYVTTNRGTLEIEAVDDSVQVVISRVASDGLNENGERAVEVKFVDTVSGSTVRTLPSGEYSVQLLGDGTGFELSANRFVLKRGGKVVVRVNRREEAASVGASRHPLAKSARSADSR